MMNKKLIPVIVLSVLLPIVGVVGFSIQNDDTMQSYDDTSLSNDEVNYGNTVSPEDGKITSYVYGLSANHSPTQLVELADLIFLGDVKFVNIVEEKHNSESRNKMVFTYYEIKPTEIFKGTPILNENGYVLLRIPGGDTEDYGTISEHLRFSENDHVFMYLAFHDEESPRYIPVGGIDTSHIIRDDEAMKYDHLHGSEIVDTSDMLDEHKALIESLE